MAKSSVDVETKPLQKHVQVIIQQTGQGEGTKQSYTHSKSKAVTMIQDEYTNDEWSGSQEEDIRNMNSLTVKSYSDNSVRSTIIKT